jgi:hypothetical protein
LTEAATPCRGIFSYLPGIEQQQANRTDHPELVC